MQPTTLPKNQYALTGISNAIALMVLAHGSATHLGSTHLVALSEALADEKIATLRFNFRYRMANRAFPGKLSDSINDFYDALQIGLDAGQGLPMFIGGHSYGGRVMTHLLVDHRLNNAPDPRKDLLRGGAGYGSIDIGKPSAITFFPGPNLWWNIGGFAHNVPRLCLLVCSKLPSISGFAPAMHVRLRRHA